MLIFEYVEKADIGSIFEKINCDSCKAYRSIVSAIAVEYDMVEYTKVGGAYMFKLSSPHKPPVFSMPMGDGWNVLIPLLVVYTQEQYIHTLYKGIMAEDVNTLLAMYPGSRIKAENDGVIGGHDTYTILIR